MSTPVQTSLASMRNVDAPQQNAPLVTIGFGSNQAFELMQRVSKMFAGSSLVPVAYQGSVGNCCIALNMAQRMGADPLQVMQNLYIVHGNPSWSSKFMIASVNVCGRFSALRYEWKGETGKTNQGCRAWAIEKETGERLNGAWITWEMVEKEGWSKKNGSKWLSMREQMFIYRAAAFWQRAYAPELTMGLSTAEEQVDIIDLERQPGGGYAVNLDEIRTGTPPVPTRQTPNAETVDVTTGEIMPASNGVADEGATASAAVAEVFVEPQPDAMPSMTYAQVADVLTKAKTVDALDEAADLIKSVEDKVQRDELSAMYGQRKEQIENPPKPRARQQQAPINME